MDADWTIAPNTNLAVPWLWICALAAAWSRYKSDGVSLGHAFGLEGGQGKAPTIEKLKHMLDERAIAHWIGSRLRDARVKQKKSRVEDLIQEAAAKFERSDTTIRRAWRRFGRLERMRTSERS